MKERIDTTARMDTETPAAKPLGTKETVAPTAVSTFESTVNSERASAPATVPASASAGARAALLGALTALALVAGYIEMLVPVPVGIPGIKLGLGNIVVLFALARLGARPAFALMVAKVSCSSVLFGNPQVFIFSLAGGVVSWALMALALRSRAFSIPAVSVLGGLSHNAGQLAMVALTLSPQVAVANAPILAITGVLCGLVIGLAEQAVLRAVPAIPQGGNRG